MPTDPLLQAMKLMDGSETRPSPPCEPLVIISALGSERGRHSFSLEAAGEAAPSGN